MARTSSVIVGIGAIAAMIVAAIVAVGVRGPGWRHMFSSAVRAIRSEDDHPHWELLMQ